MVFRRRSYAKRRRSLRTSKGRKYLYARGGGVITKTNPMIRASLQPRVMMKRTAYGGSWTFGTATTSDWWRYETFNTSKINNFAEIAALFDEYKVNAIKVTYRPQYDTVVLPTTATTVIGQPQAYAHVIVDPASTLAPSGLYTTAQLNTLLEHQGVRTFTLNKPFSVYLKPMVQDQVFGGGTASRIVKPTFMKTTETAVDHRGYHIFLQQNNMSTGNVNIKLDVFYTFYLSARNLK